MISAGWLVAATASVAGATSAESQQQLTGAYAEHLYTSLCAQEYRGRFSADQLSPADRAQLNAHTLGACKCLYSAIAAHNSPPDIVDYVMYVYGATPEPGTVDAEAMAYNDSDRVWAIGQIVGDEAIRKKCGFIN